MPTTLSKRPKVKRRVPREMSRDDICNVEFVGVIEDTLGILQMLNEAGNDYYDAVQNDDARWTIVEGGER